MASLLLSTSQIYTVVAVDATAVDSVNLSSSPEVGKAAEEWELEVCSWNSMIKIEITALE